MKLLIALMGTLWWVGCASNMEVDQAVNASSDKEVVTVTSHTTTQAIKDVKIVYFEVKKILPNNPALPMRSVKLVWKIKHADEARTRLEDHWVASSGHEWVQIQAGVETPFRLVAHGLDQSVDIKLITVLAN